ncbi:hypothetical protein EIP91_002876 [Steccherinum ochraceum]|uniref:Transcription factor domain-containing protein n=1 Tax=Steccherinum ochraceum TaxID=92696 RepID=A0A4R0RNZ1_9APHY|nr:hypothetical protein EIP91_002876 [Steccherinum ochraceum]
MATHNLPYPLSDNRSYIASHSSRIQPDALYSPQDLQYRPPSSYKNQDYRYYASPRSTGPVLQGVIEDIHDVRAGYDANLQAGGSYVTSSVDPRYSPTDPYRPPEVGQHYTAPSPSTSSHSPPVNSEPLPSSSRTLEATQASATPGAAIPSSSKRKDKPRLALSADQPLTSQGKPRTRVYVACVQWRTTRFPPLASLPSRSRKIRCDGAKPICHNCSRRPGVSPTDTPECSYDAQPKRRGPDRNPGARQRVTAQETSDGGKVHRRRRRQAEPASDKGSGVNVNSPTNEDLPDGRHQRTMRMDPIGDISAAAQSQVPTRPTGLTVVVDDLDAYTDQNRNTAYSLGSSSGSSHIVSPLQYTPSIQDPVAPHSGVASLAQPQELTHFSHSPLYYKPPESTLTYVGYVPSAIIAGTNTDGYSYEYDESGEQKTEIGAEPSMRFSRDTWWDALLLLYSGRAHGQPPDSSALTSAQRESTVQQVLTDLRQLFRASNYWFSFLNVSRFFTRLLDPQQRCIVQPSLVLAALAVSVFIHSSEREGGAKGRAWAMRLRDEAQGALEASLNSRSIDVNLVHAAWLIAFFEICAHPQHSGLRVHSTFSTLDGLIRTLALTQVDKDDARVTAFAAHLVPTIPASSHPQSQINQWNPSASQVPTESVQSPCTCAAYTLGHNNSSAQQVTPLWLTTPAWGSNWTEAEISKEECRRVVWSSMMLSAGHSSYTSASGGFAQMDLFVNDPANYAVFFPGEAIMSPGVLSKDSIWALYMRSMLLWHSCIRMRRSQTLSHGDKARYAVNAWLEVDKIEEGLSRHTCNIERAYLFQGREYLFNCRMCISHEFSRFIPQATANANLLFHRKKAEEWLTHQAWVAKTVVNGLQTVTGQPNVSIGKRPFFVFWFMSQIRRALTLWSCDNSLIVALDVSKTLMGPIEFLMSLWPCSEQRRRYQDLIDILVNACATAGIPPPQIYSPLNITRPLPR